MNDALELNDDRDATATGLDLFTLGSDVGVARVPHIEDDFFRSSGVECMDAATTSRALESAAQVSYHWNIATDRIVWSANTAKVLGVDPAKLMTGRSFAAHLDSENFTSRFDTVMHSNKMDDGTGIKYEIEYRFLPNGKGTSHTIWIEDTGCWFGSRTSGPEDVYGIMRLADQRHMRDQQMNYLSNCDPLTGMMNRARMTDALGEAVSVASSTKTPCAFAIVAVNNLDVMNEAYGYEVADEVIVALSQRLRQVMRMGDGIARYSGSKFGIILNGCKPAELNAALERFMRAVRDSVIETRMGPVWALLSIGAVSLPALGDTAGAAIAHAEEALSEAFRLPSDGYVVFTSSEERKSRRLLNARCATEIVSCLREGLFKLAFQPILNTKTGEVLMHEALLRMADTTGVLITAGHLVPIAERLGLIRLIDRAVLQLALSTLQNYSDAKLSVNISATTVVDQRWNSQLLDMIAAQPEPASRLVVEITETAALDDPATSLAFVTALRELGCGVALDDFGAGYSSYHNLKQLPLTHIKLDGSFCRDLNLHTDNRIFVQSMIDLSHALDLKVVAEWVENEADAELLAQMGVDCLQGNLFGEASIVAPWATVHGSGFELTPSSLAPVSQSYFEAPVNDISVPRASSVEEVTPSPDAYPGSARQMSPVTAKSFQVAELDDETLDAEIRALMQVEDENDEVGASIGPDLTPAYETALADLDYAPLDGTNVPDVVVLPGLKPGGEFAAANPPPIEDYVGAVVMSPVVEIRLDDVPGRMELEAEDAYLEISVSGDTAADDGGEPAGHAAYAETDFSSSDEHLEQLRQVLADLSAAFRPQATEDADKTDRLAS